MGPVVPAPCSGSRRGPPSSSSSSSYISCSPPTFSSPPPFSSTGAGIAHADCHWPETLDEDAVYRCLDRLEDAAQLLNRGTKKGKITSRLSSTQKSNKKHVSKGYPGLHRKKTQHYHSQPNACADQDGLVYRCSVTGINEEQSYEEEEQQEEIPMLQLAVLLFEKSITVPMGSLFICSKLDMEPCKAACRLAFFGRLLLTLDPREVPAAIIASQKVSAPSSSVPTARLHQQLLHTSRSSSSSCVFHTIPKSLWLHPALQQLKIFKRKKKIGVVERFLFIPPCKCSSEHTSDMRSPHTGPISFHSTSFSSGQLHSSSSVNSGSQGIPKRIVVCFTSSLIGKGLFKSSQHVNTFLGFCVAVLPAASLENVAALASIALGSSSPNDVVHTTQYSFLSRLKAREKRADRDEEREADVESSQQPVRGASQRGLESSSSSSRCISSSDRSGGEGLLRSSGSVILGRIEKPFGSKGKFVVQLNRPIPCTAIRCLIPRDDTSGDSHTVFNVVLEYEKKLFADTNQFSQFAHFNGL